MSIEKNNQTTNQTPVSNFDQTEPYFLFEEEVENEFVGFPMIQKYQASLRSFLEEEDSMIVFYNVFFTDLEFFQLMDELSEYQQPNATEPITNKLKYLHFVNCGNLTNLDLSGYNFPSLEYLHFDKLSNLSSINLSGLEAENLSLLDVSACDKLKIFDISPEILSQLKTLNLSFVGLEQIDFSNQNLSNLTTFSCQSLELSGLNLEGANLTNLKHFQCNCPELSFLSLQGSQFASIEKMDFSACSSLDILDLSGLSLDSLKHLDYIEYTNFSEIKIDNKVNLLKSRNMLREFEANLPNGLDLRLVLDYFDGKEIQIGTKFQTIELRKNPNIFLGLIKTMNANNQNPGEDTTVYFDRVQGIYSQNIINFISAGKNDFYTVEDLGNGQEKLSPNPNNIVFSIFAQDDNAALTQEIRTSGTLLSQTLYTDPNNYHNYNRNEVDQISPKKIIRDIKKTIRQNPDANIIIFMSGHGDEFGNMTYGVDYKGKEFLFTKQDFADLFNLGPQVHINIMSCESGYKDDDTKLQKNKISKNIFTTQLTNLPNYANNDLGSLVLDSSLYRAIGGNEAESSVYSFYQALGMLPDQLDSDGDPTYFPDADFDGNGVVSYHEAVVYRNIHYNYSLTPTAFDDDNNSSTDAVELSR